MPGAHRLRIAAALDNLSRIREFVAGSANELGVDALAIPELCLAVDEAATNVVVHGYTGSPQDLEVEMRIDGEDLVIKLSDQAPPFDPTSRTPPDPLSRLATDEVGGWGLHLIRRAVDDMGHRVTANGGNELTLVKRGVVGRH